MDIKSADIELKRIKKKKKQEKSEAITLTYRSLYICIVQSDPKVIKLSFMFNSDEQEIYFAKKY